MHVGGKCQTNRKGNVEVGIHHFTFLLPCRRIPVSPILANTGYSLTDYSHPHGFERICLFIYISSIAHDAGHPFMCLLTIYVSSFSKRSFRYCMHFKIRLFVFIVEFKLEFLIYSSYSCLADV